MVKVLGLMLPLALVAMPVQAEEEVATGQVWTFRDAPSEDFRILIGDVEFIPDLGDAVSVLVFQANPSFQGVPEYGIIVYHMPFERKSLVNNLDELQYDDVPVPDGYRVGYSEWYYAFQNDGAGIFTLSPTEALYAIFTGVYAQ